MCRRNCSNRSVNHLIFVFFFNETATTEIYTLSLHDALPISAGTRLIAADLAPTGRVLRIARRRLRRSEEHTSELQSHVNLVCRLLLEKKKLTNNIVCYRPINRRNTV